MANGDDQLDVVQHPVLGTLKFPKSMPYDERNKIIADMEKTAPSAIPGFNERMASLASKSQQGFLAKNAPKFTREREAAQATTGVGKTLKGAGFGPQNIEENVRIGAGNLTQMPKSVLQMVTKEPETTTEKVIGGVTGTPGLVLKRAIEGGFDWASGLGEQAGTGDIGGALARGGTEYLGGKSAGEMTAKFAGKAIQKVQEFKQKPALAQRLAEAVHDRGLAVKEHVSKVANAYRTEAQARMAEVSAGVDAAKPEGIGKQPIQDAIRADLGEIVKIPEKLPPSLQKVLAGPSLDDASVFRGAGIAGRGMTSPSGTVNVAEVPGMAGEILREKLKLPSNAYRTPIPTTEAWTFEQLKQLRTDLGNDIWGSGRTSMVSSVRTAARNAYKMISDALQSQAKEAGFGDRWKIANDQWHQYTSDFQRSPVRKIMAGENAQDITKPLSGKTAVQVQRILEKYGDYGYNAKSIAKDVHTVSEAARAVERGKLSKYDLGILAASIGSAFVEPHLPIAGLMYEGGRLVLPKVEQSLLRRSAAKRGPIKTEVRSEQLREMLKKQE